MFAHGASLTEKQTDTRFLPQSLPILFPQNMWEATCF